MEGNEIAMWYDQVLHNILNYDANKRKGHLARIQEEIGVKKLRLLKPIVTRWLCRGKASERVNQVWVSLVKEFCEDASESAAADSLHQLCLSNKFIAALFCFVLFVLQLLVLPQWATATTADTFLNVYHGTQGYG